MNTIFHRAQTLASVAAALADDTPAIKRVAVLAAAVCMAASLAGCGGGGGGGGGAVLPPAPVVPPPSVAAADSYLVAGSSSSETGHRVLVADAETEATRSAAVLSLPVQAAPPMLTATAYVADANARTLSHRGSAMAFFVNAGQLWQINLTRSSTPAGVRISAIADACRPLLVAPLDTAALDAWVLVSTAGADGNCDTAADNGQAFVRSSTAATDAATYLPAGTHVQPAYLSGDDGSLWWMLALDTAAATPRLVAYGPQLNRVDVAGGEGIQSLQGLRYGASADDGTFVRADNSLRRIEASPTTVSIGAPQLTYSGTSWLAVYDRPTLYLNDGANIYKVQGSAAATLLATPNPGSASSLLLAQSTDKLVLRQQQASGASVVSAIDKQSGAVTPLLSLPGDGSNEVWAVHGNQLVYFTGAEAMVGELRRVQLDGSGDTLVAGNLLMVGSVSSRLWDKAQTAMMGGRTALLACQPLPGNTDCRGSTLVQIDLATRAITALGGFANSSASGWLAQGGTAYEGIKGAVVEVHSRTGAAAAGYSRKDLYVFNPGEANSLKQVSSAAP